MYKLFPIALSKYVAEVKFVKSNQGNQIAAINYTVICLNIFLFFFY